ncbi:MAG TPA: chitosanase [Candidatus Saccharimonadales bacterium]
MRRTHYELGVNMHRPPAVLGSLARWQAAVLTAIVLLLGAGYAGVLPGVGTAGGSGAGQRADVTDTSAADQARKQKRPATSGRAQNVTGRSSLKVKAPVSRIPSARPSVSVTTVLQPSSPMSSPQTSAMAPAPSGAISLARQPASGTIAVAPTVLPLVDPPETPAVASAGPNAQQSAPTPVITSSVTIAVTDPALPSIQLPAVTARPDLNDPAKKDITMQLVSSAENSSLNWKGQYGYIEDIRDGRGYTAGIIGFCSGTGDMLELVRYYTKLNPRNSLAKYLPALQKVNGTASHDGLDPSFVEEWSTAARDPLFQKAQNDERDRVYFNPAVKQAKDDGLHALGQFIYYDAIVMHGPGNTPVSFDGIRATAMQKARTPAQGGDETAYLHAFLDARAAAMKTEAAHDNVDRVETAQRVFLASGNLDLQTPLNWRVYGDSYSIK